MVALAHGASGHAEQEVIMAFSNREKQTRWRKRHQTEHLLEKLARGPSIKRYGVGASFAVAGWGDHVFAVKRTDLDAVLSRLWAAAARADLPGGLGTWLRSCDKRPEVKIIVGRAPLTRAEAVAAAKTLGGGPVDRGRAVAVLAADGRLRCYPSVVAAAMGEGVPPRSCYSAWLTLTPDRAGRIWLRL
jgi:hypothetical protein